MNAARPYRTLAAAGVLVLAVSVFFHRLQTGSLSVLERDFLDELHGPGFLLIACGIALLARRALPGARGFVAGGLISTVIAVVSELSQVTTNRDASLLDFGHDLGGIATGVLLAALFTGALPPRLNRRGARLLTAVLAGVMSIAIAAPAAGALGNLWRQHDQLPLLVDFAHPWEERLYPSTAGLTTRWAATPPGGAPDDSVARLELGRPGLPGLALYPHGDWRGYDQLVVAIAADGPTPFTLRIDDAAHTQAYSDRYNARFDATREWREIRIPLADVAAAPRDRDMDLSRVQSVILFGPAADPPTYLYVAWLRLE